MRNDAAVGTWEFQKPRISVGRSRVSDIRLEDPAISRTHCYFELTGEGIRIRDNRSRHGIHLHGERVEQATLGSEDEVSIAPYRLRSFLVHGGTATELVPLEPPALEVTEPREPRTRGR